MVPEFDEDQTGFAVEVEKPKLSKPPMYKVLLMNDDYTPMEFVVHILETFFGMNREQATKVMLSVHNKGMGVCGVFPRDVADTKAQQVNNYARAQNHPLLCTIEISE